MTRTDRFKELCEEWFGEVPSEAGGYDTTGEEDAAEYLYGDGNEPPKELKRFCLVTTGGEHAYLYPDAATLDGVAEILGWKCGDTSFGEGPVQVVDLDTGAIYWPQWETLRFKVTSAAPTASPES